MSMPITMIIIVIVMIMIMIVIVIIMVIFIMVMLINLLIRALSWEESRQQCLLQGADLAEMNR